jgi:methyl-accepting chemotaxis protein
MERSLREIAAGDLTSKIYLRKGDSLHNVADAINQLIDNFRTVVRKTRDLSGQMTVNIDKIDTDDEEVNKRIGSLKGISDEIDELFSQFSLDDQPTVNQTSPEEPEKTDNSEEIEKPE